MSLLEDLQRVYRFHCDNEWVQGSNRVLVSKWDEPARYGYCLVGSIIYGMGWSESIEPEAVEWDRFMDITTALQAELPKELGPGGDELFGFNDIVATKKEDITDLIKRTITAEMARVGAELMGGSK